MLLTKGELTPIETDLHNEEISNFVIDLKELVKNHYFNKKNKSATPFCRMSEETYQKLVNKIANFDAKETARAMKHADSLRSELNKNPFGFCCFRL